MPNLLRFSLFSSLIAGISFMTNAQPYILNKPGSPSVVRRVLRIKQDSVVKDTAPVFGITANKLNQINDEPRTIPGEPFSRMDIIRSQQELSDLQYFRQDKTIKP